MLSLPVVGVVTGDQIKKKKKVTPLVLLDYSVYGPLDSVINLVAFLIFLYSYGCATRRLHGGTSHSNGRLL